MVIPNETAATMATTNSPMILTPVDTEVRPKPAPVGSSKTWRFEQTTSEGGPADAIGERDSYAVTAFSEIIDRSLHAAAARFTMGISPAALAHAYLDWAT